ncbi:MAG TPA: hypothetical protein VEK56_10560 [Vicinamibacterales bacterium]|nr:hypothetical protein [Vicinamibacterales bacterium]
MTAADCAPDAYVVDSIGRSCGCRPAVGMGGWGSGGGGVGTGWFGDGGDGAGGSGFGGGFVGPGGGF